MSDLKKCDFLFFKAASNVSSWASAFLRLFVMCDGSRMIDLRNYSNCSFSFDFWSNLGLVVSEPNKELGE